MLLAKSDLFSNFVDLQLDILSVNGRLTGRHLQHASKHVDCCCLARSVVPEQRHDLVLFN